MPEISQCFTFTSGRKSKLRVKSTLGKLALTLALGRFPERPPEGPLRFTFGPEAFNSTQTLFKTSVVLKQNLKKTLTLNLRFEEFDVKV